MRMSAPSTMKPSPTSLTFPLRIEATLSSHTVSTEGQYPAWSGRGTADPTSTSPRRPTRFPIMVESAASTASIVGGGSHSSSSAT